MEELLSKYGGGVKPLVRGLKIKGTVIGKSSKRLTLDIDRKSEGLVAEKAFNESKDFIKTLNVGDEVIASVIVPETPEGYTILSLRGAQQEAAWKKVEEAYKKGSPIVVLGKSVTSSGVMVDINSLAGFIPNSQLGKEIAKSAKDLVGEHFRVKVIEIDRRANRIVLSEKEVSDAEDIKLAKKALAKIKVGDIYEGVVMNVMSFGCFVEVKVALNKQKIAIEGLVHISEISWDKIENVEKECKEGRKVKVKVIGIDNGRLALSMKQATDDPWKKAGKKYKTDSKHKGKVVRISDFGVFVQLEPGVEGLIHITKIPPGTRLERGEEVNVYVEEIDPKSKKLSLGLVLTAKPLGYK